MVNFHSDLQRPFLHKEEEENQASVTRYISGEHASRQHCTQSGGRGPETPTVLRTLQGCAVTRDQTDQETEGTEDLEAGRYLEFCKTSKGR